MYIVPIGWIYVALMMSVAEASNSNGTVLGAVVTFLLYGLLPVGLVLYIMGTPGRKRLLHEREAQARADYLAAHPPVNGQTLAETPDAGSQTPADGVTPMRKEP
jgi:hypothetical protein